MKLKFSLLSLVLVLTQSPLWAMAKQPDPNAPPPPAWVQIVPFVVMLGVFYFLLIRPQMKQKKEKEGMMKELKKGDKVITQGGLIGTIMNINPTTMDLKIDDNTKVKFLKTAVLEIYKEPTETPVVASK